MKAAAPVPSRSRKHNSTSLPNRLRQAVGNSLNLSELKVEARRAPERGCWQVRLQKGRERSDWLTLDAGAVAVIKKVALLPPKLLGQFRLAYETIINKDLEVRH